MTPFGIRLLRFNNNLILVVVTTCQTYCKNRWITIPISRYFSLLIGKGQDLLFSTFN